MFKWGVQSLASTLICDFRRIKDRQLGRSGIFAKDLSMVSNLAQTSLQWSNNVVIHSFFIHLLCWHQSVTNAPSSKRVYFFNWYHARDCWVQGRIHSICTAILNFVHFRCSFMNWYPISIHQIIERSFLSKKVTNLWDSRHLSRVAISDAR